MTTKAIYTTILYTIYKITNLLNGKSYIGFTSDYKIRKYNHIWQSKKDKPQQIIQRAIKKHGIQNFKWDIIYQSPTYETTLKVMEPFYIALYNTCILNKNSHGYNGTFGGDEPYMLGKKHSDGTIKNLKDIHNTPEMKKQHSITSKQNWKNNKIRKQMILNITKSKNTQEAKKQQSIRCKKAWSNPEKRKSWIKSIKKLANSPKGKRQRKINASKKYQTTLPSGDQIIFIGLKQFCEKHNLNYGSVRIYIHQNKKYKGYKFKQIL